MRDEPPQELIALLERLQLATAAQVSRMGRRVRRLARQLPLFESVWVDALAQARILTPFQAAEINARRGEALRVGPCVLCGRLPSPGYADWYNAREIDSGRTVQLAVIRSAESQRSVLVDRLETLAVKSASLDGDVLAPVTEVGTDGGRIWAVSRRVAGRPAAQWMVQSGRFPPLVVLEIARQMLLGLIALEKAGLCHGDISATGAILTCGGQVVLPQPGVRGAARPEEGFARADLTPEAYDYLAPERVRDGTPPLTASDVYACGCLWWHLLTGRPPVPGGSSLAKLRGAQTARIAEVTQLAPDTPAALAAAVSASMQREPSLRPKSMAQLGTLLGPPTRTGKLALARCLSRPAPHWPRRSEAYRRRAGPKRTYLRLGVAAACVAAAVLMSRSVGDLEVPLPVASIPAASPGGAEEVGRAEEARRASAPSVPTSPAGVPDSPTDGTVDDLVLPAGGPLTLEPSQLKPGQCVRGDAGNRAVVAAPPTGLVVQPEGLRFQDIDFIWDDSGQGGSVPESEAAVIHVLAARVEFRGCSFQAAATADGCPVAVRWSHPEDRNRAGLSLPSGQVRLGDCVFRRVAAGVACQTLGALAVEMANVLDLATGPLVRLDHWPQPDEPVLVRLSQVTLREAGPLLDCRYGRIGDRPGTLSIQANGCAFVPRPEAALLSFRGPASPEPLLGAVRWNGQGSLVSPDGIIAAWEGPEGELRRLDDASISMAGLVRSEVRFAGAAGAGPEASQIVRWQVPLRSPNPPGVDPQTLDWPKR